ncbi:VTT domain-containing protein [Aeromonas schubertii]|uniref:VTT domain-containing protein n=1 Tax=Aeromonas schubertii TaxID=652 RepID=A0ABS7VCY6_9GAMM|nr:VTT domain-containing protein [Aeromonas schubertii]MBZ6067242.1 VTT domain-containing protein [Aeromonas schubertii]
MQEMLVAIWQQDYEQLSHLGAVGLLVTCLVVILFLESSFVFLPLPGDSLVLLAGGLVGLGVLGPEVTLLYLPLAAGLGSMVAYWQGHALAGTRFMHHIERLIPEGSVERAGGLLKRYGFLAMFLSRFIPFVRVLTPMLMGVSRLHLPRVALVSFASAFLWSLALSLISKGMMQVPLLAEYHHLFAKCLLVTSLLLFMMAIITIGLRLYRRRQLGRAANPGE